jgi:hypothetical protein
MPWERVVRPGSSTRTFTCLSTRRGACCLEWETVHQHGALEGGTQT